MTRTIPHIRDARRSATRRLQLILGAISLATLAAGLAAQYFASAAELGSEVVETAAFGMLLAGVAHAIALWLWDR